jgi:hypothetical protein
VKKLKLGLSFLFVTLSVAIFTLLSWVLESGELSVSALEPSLLPSSQSVYGVLVAQQSAPLQVRVQDAWGASQ